MELRKIHNMDCVKGMELLPARYINLLYTDPPYNMNSRYKINPQTGHYEFMGKGTDFMAKWDAMDGLWWDKYFKEAFRVMKYGGFVIMHNIDRQSDMWTYYARRAGFMPVQKLYWLFVSNFPKASDVALMIDKKLKVDRNVVGQAEQYMSTGTGVYNWNNPDIAQAQKQKLTDMRGGAMMASEREGREKLIRDVTEATSDLAKKYDGYKYGQAALKQILEEILVFWKLPQTGVIDDILSLEKGNMEVHPSILNIRDTRVAPTRKLKDEKSRHTPQMLVDKRIAPYMKSNRGYATDVLGISESLVKLEYTQEELEQLSQIQFLQEDFDDSYFYEPKTSKAEKEEGLDGFETVENRKATKGLYNADGKDKWATKSKNPHPTPKPIALCKWVLSLFTPPCPIRVLDTFSGQGSIPRSCMEMGIDWIGFELNPEFCEIANVKADTAKIDLFTNQGEQ